MCEIDLLVQGMFGFFGVLTSYIIYKHIKSREHKNYINKVETVLDKAELRLKDF